MKALIITEKYPYGSLHEYSDLKLAVVKFHFVNQSLKRLP